MRLRSFALAGLTLAALSSSALAVDTGWYIGLGAGYSMPQSVKFPTTGIVDANGVPYLADRAGLKNTWRGIGTLGYAWENNFRFEAEAGYTDPKVGSLKLAGVKTSIDNVDVTEFTAMGNLLYDIPVGERWYMTLGAGGGWNWTALDLNRIKIRSAGLTSQGIAGITYKMSSTTDLQLDYRYVMTNGLENFNLGHKVNLTSHNVMLSVRWYFDQPAPPPPTFNSAPPPPPAPMPLPAPPPPPPVTSFIVFFDFDKSNLTDSAQAIVAEAVKVAKTNGFVKVQIVGHTDTTGSVKYNLNLSVQRAQSVKDEMIHDGLDGSSIGIDGKGFEDQLVATGPGIREPKNRRAVIDLGQ